MTNSTGPALVFTPKHSTSKADPSWNHDASTLPKPPDFLAKLHTALGLTGTPLLVGDLDQEIDPRTDGLIPMISLTDLGREWGIEDPWGEGFCAICRKLIVKVTEVFEGAFFNLYSSEEDSQFGFEGECLRVEEESKRAWMEYEAANAAEEEGVIRYFLMSVATALVFNDQVYAPEDARNAVLEEGGLPFTLAHLLVISIGWAQRFNQAGIRYSNAIGSESYLNGRRPGISGFATSLGWGPFVCPVLGSLGWRPELDKVMASRALPRHGAAAGFPKIPKAA